MNWDAAGAIGEIIGAVAVIATLVYLALQIRQQNVAHNAQAMEEILEGFNRANEHLATNPELATLFIRGLNSPDRLTAAEAAQFSWLFRLFINQYSKMHGAHRRGLIAESDWRNLASQGAYLLDTPGGMRWVEGHGNFQDFYAELRSVDHDNKSIDLSLGRSWDEY